MTDQNRGQHRHSDPMIEARVELVRGKGEAEIIQGLVQSGLDPGSTARIVEAAKQDLLDPAILKATKEYVAKISFLDALEKSMLALITEGEPNPASPGDKPTSAETARAPEERAARFLAQVVSTNYLLGWSESESKLALAEFGLADREATRLIESVIADRKLMGDSERQLEETMFQFTRGVLEEGFEKGTPDEELVARVKQSGFNDDIARYVVRAVKMTRSHERAREEAADYATSRVQRAMYYGYPIVLPPNPEWQHLPTEEQREMKSWERRLQDWRNRPVVLGLFAYCVLAAYSPWLPSILLSLSISVVLGALFTVWHSRAADKFLARFGPMLLVAGLVFLVWQVLMGTIGWLPALAGVILVYIGALFLLILARGLVWRLRT